MKNLTQELEHLSSKTSLIIGTEPELFRLVPPLLGRSGFICDTITSFSINSKINHIRNSIVTDGSIELIVRHAFESLQNSYDLIVICDDLLLKLISDSKFSDDQKAQLLPISDFEKRGHLYSKIGLANALKDSDILSPDFQIANSNSELIDACSLIGFPLLIKQDSCGGGKGVALIQSFSDLKCSICQHWEFPLLIQKKIDGLIVDCSGFYQDGKLIHFSFSYFLNYADGKFGPSKDRLYLQRAALPKEVWTELSRLGEILGLNGFISITCIERIENKQRYYFEADARPNAWIDYSKYLGDDPADAIRDFFRSGYHKLYNDIALNSKMPKAVKISYFFRMNGIDILMNNSCLRFLRDFSITSIFQHLAKVFLFAPSLLVLNRTLQFIDLIKFKLYLKVSLDLAKDNLRRTKLINFSFPEKNGRWSDGTPATIVWNTDLPKNFRLILEIHNVFSSNSSNKLVVSIDGQTIILEVTKLPHQFSLLFHGIRGSVRLIEIQIPFPTSPFKLNKSADRRLLGIFLKKIIICPIKDASKNIT